MLLRPDSRRMESNPTESIIGEHKYEDSDSSSFNVIIGAVIATLVLVFICLILVILHYMYKHKGTYHTNEAKGSEFAETADTALQGDPVLQDTMDESKKEYFI